MVRNDLRETVGSGDQGSCRRAKDAVVFLSSIRSCTTQYYGYFFFKSLITPGIIYPSVYCLSPTRKDADIVPFTAGSPTARAVPRSRRRSINIECVNIRACLFSLNESFKVSKWLDSSSCPWGLAQSLAYTCCLINTLRISE